MLNKKIFFVFCTLTAAILGATPVQEFDAGKKNIPAGIRYITADGKFHQAENTAVPVELDGKKLLALPCKNTEAHTVYARIKWSKTPTGAIFSRHRTMDGTRGYEAGFSKKAFFIHHAGYSIAAAA